MPKPKLNFELKDALVTAKLLTRTQVQELAHEAETTHRTFEDVLTASGLVKEADLLQTKSKLFNMPFVDLMERTIPREVLLLLPQELAENYQMVVHEREGNNLSVAMVNPLNFKAIEAVEFIARENKWKLKYYLTSAEGLGHALKGYETLKAEVTEALTQAEVKYKAQPKSQTSSDAEFDFGEGEKLEEVVKSAPVAKMVNVILRHAVEGNASDVHIEPVMDETRVRYRLDGVLHTSLVLPRYIHLAIVSRIKVLANLKIDETRLPQDGRIRLILSGRTVDFRVSTMPLLNSEKVVLRILDSSAGVRTFEELGFWGKTLEVVHENLLKSRGMFLVTGPTGSGKSTTLYTVLNQLNEEGSNVITLEDPVEYYLGGVNQSQINTEVGLTFASGLRSILRQDPDIIMVGEIRDSETAELAIRAALTGHIVLSTLHTNDAFGAIPRLIDMHIEPFLLTSTVNVVVAQRLVRRVCRYCARDVAPPPEVLEKMRAVLKTLPSAAQEHLPAEPWVFRQGDGCGRCNNTGYHGRLVVAEALANTPQLQQIILAGANPAEVRKEFVRQGMVDMAQDGYLKVLQGLTTMEEVLTATND